MIHVNDFLRGPVKIQGNSSTAVLQLEQEGSGKAIEIVDAAGNVLNSIDRAGVLASGGGSFAGGLISGVTQLTTADTTHDQLVITVPTGLAPNYPMLIQSHSPDLVNTEARWFMAHPEGGLCLSSAYEPNWAILHMYPYGNGQVKNIVRITEPVANNGGNPNTLFAIGPKGNIIGTVIDASVSPISISDHNGNVAFAIDNANAVTGRAASRLRDSRQIITTALGFKTMTCDRPTNTGDNFGTGVFRATAIGLRGGETYNSVSFSALTAAAGLTLFKVGIYDSSFNLVASSASAHAAVNGTAGLNTVNLSSAYTPAADGLFYVGSLGVGTTPPAVCQIVGGNGNDTSFGGKYLGWQQSGLADLPATATRASGSQPYFFATG